MPTLILHFLAQSDSSGATDFLQQISGLLAVTCAAGVVWVILMAVIFQRATERRRRKSLGLEPLPGIHVTAYQWLVKTFGTPQGRPAAPPDDSPAPPDLGLLTGDLPQPDLAAMVGDFSPPPAHEPEPVRRTAPVPEPETDTGGWRDEAPELEPEPEAAYPAAESLREDAVPLPDDIPPRDPPPESVELLRVWRDVADGGLILEIGGRRFRSLDELRSAELERRFINVLRELNSLPSSPERPATTPAPAQKTPKARAKAKDKEKDKEKDQTDPDALPSMGPGAMLRQMRRVAMGQTPDPVEPTPEVSIADQIEDLLQGRLADLPEFGGRSIHVKPSSQGGVRIEVDGTYYDGVGDVEDEDVRSLLMDVVRRWEQGR